MRHKFDYFNCLLFDGNHISVFRGVKTELTAVIWIYLAIYLRALCYSNHFEKTSFFILIFEDNSGVVEMVQVPKMQPRTKHLNIKYHHFRELVSEGKVTIHQVPTDEQLADMMTKPLSRQPFERFRLGICGW